MLYLSLIASLRLLPIQERQTPEQAAIDYFFENIFERDFPDYHVIEFNDQTKTEGYYGFIYNCENYTRALMDKVVSAPPSLLVNVNAGKCLVKVKKERRNSSRLQIEVYSSVKIDESQLIYITAYRKLRFVDHYFLTLDKDLQLTSVCKVNEVI